MGHILLHDKTNSVQIPKVDLSIVVNATDDLKKIIQQLAFAIDHTLNTAVPGCYNELHIACDCKASGLMLGTGINHDNVVELFRPLRYKVGNIVIHNKGAAFIYSNGNNGAMLCKRMALCVFANVTASASVKNQPPGGYVYNKIAKAAEGFTLNAIWNCAGKITLLNKYDENGKIVYNINYPGNNAMKLLMNATSPLHDLPKYRFQGLAAISQKIISYCNQCGHYLYLHTWKLIPARHS